ncbi:MAG: hypothetical protein JXQ91_13475 [Vannielia sp.]|uniref:hypothetical protein n=1 Tax=Rhodobacterales TaxID=204455 RepID=UPI002095757E|nr:hypothetical protein [Oceanicola sp. 502str15]MCO6382894.1 hypothetical protein [Oceanicola sp. 502str15]
MAGENSATNVVVTVTSEGISRALGGGIRGGAAGLVVQPAVWIITGTGPDAGDAFIYGTGVAGVVAGAILAVPAIITGTVKAAVDDHTASLVAEVRAKEPAEYRNSIYPVDDYSFFASGGHIQAMTIAAAGGVAWQDENGVYCFIRDANGRLVCDYRPRSYKKLYFPELPLRQVGNGFRWNYLDG